MRRALGSFLFAGLLLAGAGCGGGSPTTPAKMPKDLKGPGMSSPGGGPAPAPPPPPVPK